MAIGMQVCDRPDTAADRRDPDPTNPWLFTDPQAREIYRRKNRLLHLEEDICTYVMIQGQWSPEDLECSCEIQRSLAEGLFASGPSFGYLSPHPTVYYAMEEGALSIAGHRHPFKRGDELVFVPWLARLAHPALSGPIWIGAVQLASNPCLCCEAFPQVCVHCEKTLAVLRQILAYSTSH
jgi:hypothetical protein